MKCQEKLKQFVEVAHQLVGPSIVDLLVLLLIIYSSTKGKCFELGELGLTKESLKCRICME